MHRCGYVTNGHGRCTCVLVISGCSCRMRLLAAAKTGATGHDRLGIRIDRSLALRGVDPGSLAQVTVPPSSLSVSAIQHIYLDLHSLRAHVVHSPRLIVIQITTQ
jgi:hypothetical protein